MGEKKKKITTRVPVSSSMTAENIQAANVPQQPDTIKQKKTSFIHHDTRGTMKASGGSIQPKSDSNHEEYHFVEDLAICRRHGKLKASPGLIRCVDRLSEGFPGRVA